MKSPFPGMDPYLESHWGDLHHSCIQYARDQLQPLLPGDLRARVEERVFVESLDADDRVIYPDVHIVERPAATAKHSPSFAGTAVAEPLVIQIPHEPITEGFIEIREAGSDGRVITVIEFLSPSNKKRGEGQVLYRRKQHELRRGCVSLVEIDLLRQGRRVLSISNDRIPRSYRTQYQACLRRGWRPDAIEVFRVPLRDRLPILPVPLRQTDADVTLDLQAILDQCYQNGGYDDIDYSVDPDPPLAPDDAAWADALLRERGVRAGKA